MNAWWHRRCWVRFLGGICTFSLCLCGKSCLLRVVPLWLSLHLSSVDKLMQMCVLSIFNKHAPLPYHQTHNQYPRTHDKLWSTMVHIFSMCWAACNVLIKLWDTEIQSWAGAGFMMIHRQVCRRSLRVPLERVPAVSDRLQTAVLCIKISRDSLKALLCSLS